MYKTFTTTENNSNTTATETTTTLADWLGTSAKARTQAKKAKKEAELHSIADEASARAMAAAQHGRKKSANAYQNMAAEADKHAARLMRERANRAINTSEIATENDREAKIIKGLVIGGGAALTAYVAYHYIKDNMQSFKELADSLVK